MKLRRQLYTDQSQGASRVARRQLESEVSGNLALAAIGDVERLGDRMGKARPHFVGRDGQRERKGRCKPRHPSLPPDDICLRPPFVYRTSGRGPRHPFDNLSLKVHNSLGLDKAERRGGHMSSTRAPHHLVAMLLVTRKEFLRALEGLHPTEASIRIGGLNCIGWMVGHVAWQESLFWLKWAQGLAVPERLQPFATGHKGFIPEYAQVLADWREIRGATEPFLQRLDHERLQRHFVTQNAGVQDLRVEENAGTLLTRCVMHYWSHIGEIASVRSLLGHTAPQFVGSLQGCHYGR
jgi:hypothetical protein